MLNLFRRVLGLTEFPERGVPQFLEPTSRSAKQTKLPHLLATPNSIVTMMITMSPNNDRSTTLRSNLQVEAEAEILQVIRRLKDGQYKPPVDGMQLERTYFLSQSRILDRIPPADPVSWTPEVLYRYIIALPGEKLSPDLLQRCLLQEYLGAGVTIVDKERYERFFGPSINAANTTYREERDKYLKQISTASAPDLDAAFEEIPDLEKPFFVQQMGWRIAEKEKTRADEAQKQAKFAATEAATAEQGTCPAEDATRRKMEAQNRNPCEAIGRRGTQRSRSETPAQERATSEEAPETEVIRE